LVLMMRVINYVFEKCSEAIIHISSFIKTGLSIEKLISEDTQSQVYSQRQNKHTDSKVIP
jgi:hypothetical protein